MVEQAIEHSRDGGTGRNRSPAPSRMRGGDLRALKRWVEGQGEELRQNHRVGLPATGDSGGSGTLGGRW